MTGGWFITGTDTGVGKTRVALRILHELRERELAAVGMKPVASGCQRDARGLRNADAEALMHASTVSLDYTEVNPYAFEAPVAPHVAAAGLGSTIDLNVIIACFDRLRRRAPWIVVEGIGGWMVPLSSNMTVADLAVRLRLPVILVVGMRLGCLSHALMTAHAIREAGLPLAGWVANTIDPEMAMFDANVATLQARIDAPLLAICRRAESAESLLPCSNSLLAGLV